MIWPSGGAGALSAAVYDWIFTLVLVLRFNRFCLFQQICNQLPSCGRLASSAEIPYFLSEESSCNPLPAAAGGVRSPAVGTTARPYTACRPTPPRLSSVFRRDLRSVVCQPQSTAAGRPTPPRQLSVFQRFCVGRARGEPSAKLPAVHAHRRRSSYIPVPVPLTLFVLSLFRLTRVAADLQQATPCRRLAPVRLQRGHDFQSLSGSHCRQIAHRAYHSPQSHFGLVYVLVDAHQRAQIGGDIGFLVVVHL